MGDKEWIERLIAADLLGTISDEERERLYCALEADERLRSEYEALREETDLAGDYRIYSSIDSKRALKAFYRRTSRRGTIVRWMARVAAIVVVCWLVADGLDSWRDESAPAEISQEMAASIDKMKQSGFSGATLTINGSEAAEVADVEMARRSEAEACPDETETTIRKAIAKGAAMVEGTLVTEHNKEFWMILDDGTYVHLNSNSSLTYPIRFGSGERRVELTGQAYFVVAHDGERPFIVETPQGDVKDYGTEFDINTALADSSVSVVLVSGKASVRCGLSGERMLRPGHKAVMKRGRGVEVSTVDVAPYVAWNTGNFHFDSATLDELMMVVGRWYGREVAFGSDEIREMRFTGDLDKYDEIGPTLRAIENVTGLLISLGQGSIRIESQ